MQKLYDRPEVDERIDELPELPPDVEIPDDISGLEPPTTKRVADGVRWMRWLVAIVVLGAVGLATVLIIGTGTEVDQADGYAGTNQHLEQLEATFPTQYRGTNQHLAQLEAMAPTYADTGEYLGLDTIGVIQPEYVDTGEFLGLDTIGVTQPPFVQPESFGAEFTDMFGTEGLVFVERDPAGAAFRAMEPTWQPNLGALEQMLDPAGVRFRAMEPTWQPNLGALEQMLDPVGARFRAMEPTWQPNYELLDQIIVEHPYADFYG